MTSPLPFVAGCWRLWRVWLVCALALGPGPGGRCWGREDLLEGAAARLCVARPPVVAGARRTVHGALHVAKVRRLRSARSLMTPSPSRQ